MDYIVNIKRYYDYDNDPDTEYIFIPIIKENISKVVNSLIMISDSGKAFDGPFFSISLNLRGTSIFEEFGFPGGKTKFDPLIEAYYKTDGGTYGLVKNFPKFQMGTISVTVDSDTETKIDLLSDPIEIFLQYFGIDKNHFSSSEE